ncbi:MAG: hypothetical protein JWL90_4718, partial [Chthoniobacteraceae bacterium]|nr:hypothetical protein [Chthoniobacteraceae bacterium]
NDWLTITGGKLPNPFYSTELVWDPDINPTGFTQSIRLSKLFGGTEETGYSKDGKVLKPVESPWEWTLNLGEFIFDDNPESAFDNDASTDPWIFEAQLVGSYKFTNGIKVTLAPGYMVYTAGDVSDAINENPFSDAPGVSGETRNLSIVMLPGEVGFKLFGISSKFYWDTAYNLEGRKRAENIYGLAFNDLAGRKHSQYTREDSFAYLVGVQVGENKKKGDWALLANWRQTGIAAVDPNINESDFASGELNTRGVQLRASYNFTNFAVGTITYAHAWNFKDNLVGGQATGGAAIADENSFDLIQVDLNVKF